MCALKAVTLDAYGTVFDFESQARTAAVEEILAHAGAEDRDARDFADQWGRNFFELYDGRARAGSAGGAFRNIADITAEALSVTYRQNGIEMDPKPGTEIWLRRLADVGPYPEVQPVLESLSERFQLAMVSDIDEWVIGPALERLGWDFDFVMTSESERAYKHDRGGVIFERALERLGVFGSEAVHVGDSAADVIGARTSGMLAVWVNRHGRSLPDDCPPPDWEVSDLRALPGILETTA